MYEDGHRGLNGVRAGVACPIHATINTGRGQSLKQTALKLNPSHSGGTLRD